MRLSQQYIKIIKQSFEDIFDDGEIYLFGSRADDTKKGGDIDLYLVPSKKFEDIYTKKIQFLSKLKKYLGEQKIDIIIAKDKNRLIEQEALRGGILINIDEIKIKKYLNECDKHKMRVQKAYDDIKNILPLSSKKYLQLNDEDIKTIDQYLFRFSKLQDTIGEKLFRFIVSEYIEDISRLSFIDMLNQLEKIGILESVDEWSSLRNARNNIAHQYDDEPEDMADAINKMFAQKDILVDIYNNIKSYYENR